MSKLQEREEFPEWMKFFERKRHLPSLRLARMYVDRFGGSINTWLCRLRMFEKLSATKERQSKREEERHRHFVENILGYKYPYVQPKKRFARRIDENKTVVVSDPHEGYSHPAVWEEILKNHHDAGHLHINGDLFDFYSKSRYRKMEGHETFESELRAGFDRLQWCSSHFKRVTLIKGNHDDRSEKKLAEMVDSDMLWLTENDIVRYVASFFDNVEVVGERVEKHPISFIWQYNDVVFTHIERSQKQSSSLIDGIIQDLIRWSSLLRLRPFRWVVQGHNHRSSIENLGYAYGMLIPMAARLSGRGLRYALSPRLSGKPPVTGYAVLYFENGKAVYNKSRIYEVPQ